MATKKIAKKKKFELTPDQESRLVNPEVSGMDKSMERGGKAPRMQMYKIFQSDKQYKWFEDDANVSPKDYGKIIPSLLKGSEGLLTRLDLMDLVEGTILRVEQGAVVYLDEQGRKVPQYRLPEIVPSAERDAWLEKNAPLEYYNASRVVFSRYSAKETYELLEKLVHEDEVENPLSVIELSGTNFGRIFDIWKQMVDLLKTDKFWSQRSRDERRGVLKSLYTIKFMSKLEKSETGNEYYVWDVGVGLNSVDEALAFEKLVIELDDFPYFGEKLNTVEAEVVADSNKEQSKAKAREVLSEVENAKQAERATKEGKAKGSVVKAKAKETTTKDVDIDDLPF